MAKIDRKKDSYYFPHDFNPTSDPKMSAFISTHGAIGYGVYWRIVEMLHEDAEHRLPFEEYVYISVSSLLKITPKEVETIIIECIEPYKLFTSEGTLFWSERVFKNFATRKEISARNSKAGKISAEKRKKNKEIAEQLQREEQDDE